MHVQASSHRKPASRRADFPAVSAPLALLGAKVIREIDAKPEKVLTKRKSRTQDANVGHFTLYSSD